MTRFVESSPGIRIRQRTFSESTRFNVQTFETREAGDGQTGNFCVKRDSFVIFECVAFLTI